MKSKPAKIIYGIVVPLILLVIILAILGYNWNDFPETWIVWIFYLFIVFYMELHLFAPEDKILIRMKKRIKIIFPWIIRLFIVIIILSIVIVAIGFIISSLEIPPEKIAIIDSESKNLFIDREKIGKFEVTLKNNSDWSTNNIIIKTSIYSIENDSLVVSLKSHLLSDYWGMELRSNTSYNYFLCDIINPCEKSSINHPPNKLFIFEFLDRFIKERNLNWSTDYYSWSKILKNEFKHPPEHLFKGGYSSSFDWKFDKIYEELKNDNPDIYKKIENNYLLDRDFYVKQEIISAYRYSFLDYIIDEF